MSVCAGRGWERRDLIMCMGRHRDGDDLDGPLENSRFWMVYLFNRVSGKLVLNVKSKARWRETARRTFPVPSNPQLGFRKIIHPGVFVLDLI